MSSSKATVVVYRGLFDAEREEVPQERCLDEAKRMVSVHTRHVHRVAMLCQADAWGFFAFGTMDLSRE